MAEFYSSTTFLASRSCRTPERTDVKGGRPTPCKGKGRPLWTTFTLRF